MTRTKLVQVMQAMPISNAMLKMAMSVAIPALPDDVFTKTIPTALSVLRPLLAGDGQAATEAMNKALPADERHKLLAILDNLNGEGK
jgi:hypothetical protein